LKSYQNSVNKFGLSFVRIFYSKKGANIISFPFSLVSTVVVFKHLKC